MVFGHKRLNFVLYIRYVEQLIYLLLQNASVGETSGFQRGKGFVLILVSGHSPYVLKKFFFVGKRRRGEKGIKGLESGKSGNQG